MREIAINHTNMAKYTVKLNFIPVNQDGDPVMGETLAKYFGRNLMLRIGTINPLFEYNIGKALFENGNIEDVGEITIDSDEDYEYLKAILLASNETNAIKGQALDAITKIEE